MIVLLVQFEVREGAEEQACELIVKMQQNTRREPGCRQYAGHQSLDKPRHFFFYEVYENQAALDAHRAAPYFAEYVTNGLAQIMVAPQRELFRPLE